MVIFNNIQICLLLVIIGDLITVNNISCGIDLDCLLECEITKLLIVMQQHPVIPRTVFTADIHICIFIYNTFQSIRNRSRIPVSRAILEDNGSRVRQNLHICFAVYDRYALYFL